MVRKVGSCTLGAMLAARRCRMCFYPFTIRYPLVTSMRRYISLPRVEGKASRQAHADLPQGTYEREISKEGFFGPAALFHHKHPPTAWVDFEGPLRPHAFDLNRLAGDVASPWHAAEVLRNANVRVRYWNAPTAMDHLVRNADGDDLLFVHRGAAEFFCDYGHLSVCAGDYVVVPRGTMWRVEVSEPLSVLLIEAVNGSYQLPDKGLLGGHAIFDPAMLDAPAMNARFVAQQSDDRPWRVLVKRHNAISTVTYPFNPLDAVGWHGDLSVVRINVKDIRPIASHRYHLPPSAHTTFVGNRFVVCTFVPRPFETDPGALKVPFFHNNDDYDEVIFYHAGNFFSRDNIGPGMMTLHPCGFTHGPHPKALQNMLVQPKPATDEYAVMIDARDSLEITGAATQVEWGGYVDSWKPK
ncbi:MAG TPA: homogentisate 1,2-dioxygenase [Steroidobacteraceae bacterium]